MSIPEFDHDRHLQALFSGLDTKPDFDARLLARLRTETQIEATGPTAMAREQERARYQREVLRLRTSHRLTLRLLTLDAFGIAALLVIAIGAAWRLFGADLMGTLRELAPHILVALSILITSVPLLVMRAEESRKSIQLL